MDAPGASAENAYRRARRVAAGRWLAVAAAAVVAAVALAGGHRWVAAAGLVAALVARPARDPARWRRGADGERATAVWLDRLPARRWVVFHDRAVPGSRANIDHLVVGPTGLWVVDSKAYRGRVRARWRRVEVAGRPLDTGPTAWEAEVVSRRLGVAATPLVVLHADGIPRRGRRCGGVRVVPPFAVVRRIRRGPTVLAAADVDALTRQVELVFPPAAGGLAGGR